MTSSQILISNALYFCKKNKIRVQDFEEEIGYSRGYLATAMREGRSISLDVAVLISNRFGISISEMVSSDIQKQDRIMKLERELAKLKESN